MNTAFEFFEVPTLSDGNLTLVLERKYPGNPAIGHVPSYDFKLSPKGSDEKIGHISLRVGNTDDLMLYAGHIGYGVDEQHRGHHYSARACRLVFPIAAAHGLSELWITCDPSNAASRRICELVGGEYIETIPLAEHTDMYKAGDRHRCRYRVKLKKELPTWLQTKTRA